MALRVPSPGVSALKVRALRAAGFKCGPFTFGPTEVIVQCSELAPMEMHALLNTRNANSVSVTEVKGKADPAPKPKEAKADKPRPKARAKTTTVTEQKPRKKRRWGTGDK